jgi:Zn/Cd-binding protein ZinT
VQCVGPHSKLCGQPSAHEPQGGRQHRRHQETDERRENKDAGYFQQNQVAQRLVEKQISEWAGQISSDVRTEYFSNFSLSTSPDAVRAICHDSKTLDIKSSGAIKGWFH